MSTHQHSHNHNHNHNHAHNHDGKLGLAVFINILLTIAQIIGGVLSGSLSLIADALHNLSDAGAIFIALMARKIAAKPANKNMTYGYQRAEIIAAFINSITLILIGLYLIFEAISTYFNPTEINGWLVVWVAGIALVIDIATAILTYMSGAKDSMNIRAAFIHNVSDALASVAVIISGILIILYQWYIVDLIATIGISIYVIYHGLLLVKQSIGILMEAVPEHIAVEDIKSKIESFPYVEKAVDIHVFQLNEHKICLEGKILLSQKNYPSPLSQIKDMLRMNYSISHSTLEILLDSSEDVHECYKID
ncbi:MAG: cation diffusion facilitator family transporter [Colwellia sp.]|nr:cation diffusion facilitator family transporter [Colwellia sp.]